MVIGKGDIGLPAVEPLALGAPRRDLLLLLSSRIFGFKGLYWAHQSAHSKPVGHMQVGTLVN